MTDNALYNELFGGLVGLSRAIDNNPNVTNDNYTFYEGYEEEPEIILSLEGTSFHIWDGYFEDIYDTPPLDGNGWRGFTKDYNQMEGIFSDDDTVVEIDPKEYLADLMLYKNKAFDFKETLRVFDLLVSLFEKAVKLNLKIKASKK